MNVPHLTTDGARKKNSNHSGSRRKRRKFEINLTNNKFNADAGKRKKGEKIMFGEGEGAFCAAVSSHFFTFFCYFSSFSARYDNMWFSSRLLVSDTSFFCPCYVLHYIIFCFSPFAQKSCSFISLSAIHRMELFFPKLLFNFFLPFYVSFMAKSFHCFSFASNN